MRTEAKGVDIVCLELVLLRGDRKVRPVGLKVDYGLKEKVIP